MCQKFFSWKFWLCSLQATSKGLQANFCAVHVNGSFTVWVWSYVWCFIRLFSMVFSKSTHSYLDSWRILNTVCRKLYKLVQWCLPWYFGKKTSIWSMHTRKKVSRNDLYAQPYVLNLRVMLKNLIIGSKHVVLARQVQNCAKFDAPPEIAASVVLPGINPPKKALCGVGGLFTTEVDDHCSVAQIGHSVCCSARLKSWRPGQWTSTAPVTCNRSPSAPPHRCFGKTSEPGWESGQECFNP